MRNNLRFFRPFVLLFLFLPVLAFATSAAVPSGIRGAITISPSCAGAAKPDEVCVMPFAHAVIQLKKADGQIVKTATSAADGKFEIKVGPGLYDLQIEIDGKYPRCETVAVKVRKGKLAEVNLECDSGMR